MTSEAPGISSSLKDSNHFQAPITEQSNIVLRKETCYFFNIPFELRLKIYAFALPASRQSVYRFVRDFHNTDVALLSTCKQIFIEAYPVFVSSNNFHITRLPPLYASRQSHEIFFNNLRTVSITWHYNSGRRYNCLDSFTIQNLTQCSTLQTLHIRFRYITEDEMVKRFRTGFRDRKVMHDFVKHTALHVLLAIPQVKKFVIYEDSRKEKDKFKVSDGFKALEEYMTALFTARKAPAEHVMPLGKVVFDLVENACNEVDGDPRNEGVLAKFDVVNKRILVEADRALAILESVQFVAA